MKITAEPRSDQWNADDFIGGPRDFTIATVTEGKAEAKYDVGLEGDKRAWRPPLTILRVLIAAWGDEASDWIGQRVRLYCDTSVRYGGADVGGIRVSHMTGLPGNKTFSVRVTTTRGKRAPYTVDPLPDTQHTAVMPTADDVAGSTDVTALRAMWQAATGNPERQAQIQERVADLSTTDKDN